MLMNCQQTTDTITKQNINVCYQITTDGKFITSAFLIEQIEANIHTLHSITNRIKYKFNLPCILINAALKRNA